jgi:hypothetical protein
MRDYQWDPTPGPGSLVQKVDLLVADGGAELRETIQRGFLRPPVKAPLPVLDEVFEIGAIGSLLPLNTMELIGPAGTQEPDI